MESSMNSLLELHNIYYSYHTLDAETRALSDLSFSVQPGTFTAVVGPSGCGKSTLLSLICGLMKPDAGEILLNGIPLKENSPLIGYMLQHDHLLDWRSIYRNVTLGPEICGTLNTATKKRAYELLEQYGLKQFASARPSQLSGGMRQRAALIRTLLPDPQLLMSPFPLWIIRPGSPSATTSARLSDRVERLHFLSLMIYRKQSAFPTGSLSSPTVLPTSVAKFRFSLN